MRQYSRRLPHWEAVEQPLFVTFRLYGSLPANRVFPTEQVTSGKAFVAMDRLLDCAQSGPLHLRRPEIAELVVSALHEGEHRFERYELHAFVVMPNHVHVLVTPHVVATRLLGPLKLISNRTQLRPGWPSPLNNSRGRALRQTRAAWIGGCSQDWLPHSEYQILS